MTLKTRPISEQIKYFEAQKDKHLANAQIVDAMIETIKTCDNCKAGKERSYSNCRGCRAGNRTQFIPKD